jgi:hypothetical protein
MRMPDIDGHRDDGLPCNCSFSCSSAGPFIAYKIRLINSHMELIMLDIQPPTYTKMNVGILNLNFRESKLIIIMTFNTKVLETAGYVNC